ncbi:pyridoxamine 5'-phosphate oxidase family protein [Streptomyces luteogriseus]|uniref:pyridoxamine 5'-phosphate oxidase family protein n=1 Tax=Streptomyces luteogriseus TaxID=68233 RepID=UPI003790771B
MGTAQVRSFSEIEAAFVAYVQQTVYCTMVTVDRHNRPRARVVQPVWETVDGRPVGWLAVFRTPVKAAHLAHNPHTTYAYWHPRQDAVFVDSVSAWAPDRDTKLRAWELYRRNSPPGVGYDPHLYWSAGPDSPDYHLLRIDPWRVQVLRGSDLSSRIWAAESPQNH